LNTPAFSLLIAIVWGEETIVFTAKLEVLGNWEYPSLPLLSKHGDKFFDLIVPEHVWAFTFEFSFDIVRMFFETVILFGDYIVWKQLPFYSRFNFILLCLSLLRICLSSPTLIFTLSLKIIYFFLFKNRIPFSFWSWALQLFY